LGSQESLRGSVYDYTTTPKKRVPFAKDLGTCLRSHFNNITDRERQAEKKEKSIATIKIPRLLHPRETGRGKVQGPRKKLIVSNGERRSLVACEERLVNSLFFSTDADQKAGWKVSDAKRGENKRIGEATPQPGRRKERYSNPIENEGEARNSRKPGSGEGKNITNIEYEPLQSSNNVELNGARDAEKGDQAQLLVLSVLRKRF